jgi:hypothetical protein
MMGHAFLDANPDLWRLRVNSETGISAIREVSLVRVTPCLFPAALDARLDTAAMVDSIAPPGTYFLLCLLANRFDSGASRYRSYLAGVSRVLAQYTTPESIVALTSALLRRAS